MNGTQQNEAARRQTSGAPIGKTIGQTGEEQREASGSSDAPSSPQMAGSAPGAPAGTQSSASLSQDAQDDGRFRVAEEVNLDQQSDQARRIGQPPEDSGVVRPAEAMSDALRQDTPREAAGKDPLAKSMDRAVPPSE